MAAGVSPIWQRTGQPITITAVVTETDLLYRGDVWAELSGATAGVLFLDRPGPGSNVWQKSFSTTLEGTYNLTVSAKDKAGNITSTTGLTFTLDGVPPGLALTLSTAPPYGHVVSQTVYYGDGSGTFTATTLAYDLLSKLDRLTFPETTDDGQVILVSGLTSTIQTHRYDFTSGDSFSATVNITATDRAGHATGQPLNVVNDETAPTATVSVPTASGLGIPVAWTGQDDLAGIRHYDVQVRENGGNWDDWLTAVDYTSATFVGTLDYTYTFRIKATDNVSNTTTEWQVSQPVAVHGVTKYYTHGGSRVAMRRGDALYYLNGDHLGSTSLTTDDTGTPISEVRTLPYGEERWTNGASPTDFTFTGQRNEAGFGLMDYNARYYNPRLGRFISPDPMIPEPTSSGGFNRYRYVKNNPLKHADPSGHASCQKDDKACWDSRWYRAHGYQQDKKGNWASGHEAQLDDPEILNDVLGEMGIEAINGDKNWTWNDDLTLVAQGVVDLWNKVGGGVDNLITGETNKLKTLLGGPLQFQRDTSGCFGHEACAYPVLYNGPIIFNDDLFNNPTANPADWVRGTTVHELGHIIDWANGGFPDFPETAYLSDYAQQSKIPFDEYFPEAVALWVYPTQYTPAGKTPLDSNQHIWFNSNLLGGK